MPFRSAWSELVVYNETIAFAQRGGGVIVCASPSAGTDARFKTCIFPKPRTSLIKGLRDEVDMAIAWESCLILVEAKLALSHCLTRANRGNETDVEKLRRLAGLDEAWFLDSMSRAYAVDMRGLGRLYGLAYHLEDAELPPDMVGFWVRDRGDVLARWGPTGPPR